MTLKMPAEWEKHEATWLAWPHNEEHWPGNFSPIPDVFARIALTLAGGENVYICVKDAEMENSARNVIQGVLEKEFSSVNASIFEKIKFFHIETDASWSRDHGPIFVCDASGKFLITDWIFNSWGGKYEPWDKDDIVPQKIGKIFGMEVLEPGIVLEGGSIDVNGAGSLLTTRQCLLNKNRNPQLSQKEIEGYLAEYLGVKNVLWLEEGIVGDDTDGHIDDIARFVDAGTIVTVVEDNKDDENYEILQKNLRDLKEMRDEEGRPFKILELPMPDPVIYEDQRLPASYANFYIGNEAVIVPTFRSSKDEIALKVLSECFPSRRVVGIDCVDLVWGLGTLHCSTQQMPL